MSVSAKRFITILITSIKSPNSVSYTHLEEYEKWCKDWKTFQMPRGESFQMQYERVMDAFYKVLKENSGENILIVAHNGTLRSIFSGMMGTGMDGTWHFDFTQVAYSQVEYAYDNFTIRKINALI